MSRDWFATDRFTPGHVLGTGILVFGVIGIARELAARGTAQSAATLADAGRSAGRGQRWGARP